MKELTLKECKWIKGNTGKMRYLAEFTDSNGEKYQLDLLPIIRSVTSKDVTEIMRNQLESKLKGKKFSFMDFGIVLDVKREVLKALF